MEYVIVSYEQNIRIKTYSNVKFKEETKWPF